MAATPLGCGRSPLCGKTTKVRGECDLGERRTQSLPLMLPTLRSFSGCPALASLSFPNSLDRFLDLAKMLSQRIRSDNEAREDARSIAPSNSQDSSRPHPASAIAALAGHLAPLRCRPEFVGKHQETPPVPPRTRVTRMPRAGSSRGFSSERASSRVANDPCYRVRRLRRGRAADSSEGSTARAEFGRLIQSQSDAKPRGAT